MAFEERWLCQNVTKDVARQVMMRPGPARPILHVETFFCGPKLVRFFPFSRCW